MFQGTGSDVGKSILITGLARAYTRLGLCVRPFKPQNMSNNAAVTHDGGEIGRAQALQARACGVPPTIDMNPILLKPQSDVGAQVVVQGHVMMTASARDYAGLKPRLMPRVLDSFSRLAAEADLILIEGAGSPAEVNLRDGDVANMGFAEAADLPVVLIGDIERGGVIASIVGTCALLTPAEQMRLKAYIINKFRGDIGLFEDALEIMRDRTGLECLGVVPHFADVRHLPAEDAVVLDQPSAAATKAGNGAIRVAVPRFAHIANFDDLDPLAAEPDVALEIVEPNRALPGDADIILLPGSKTTCADLAVLRMQGWDVDIHAHLRRGKLVIGLCGGYQMLGRKILDPDGIEGPPGEIRGLELLDIETTLRPHKVLSKVTGIEVSSGEFVAGYEMHMGRTTGSDLTRPMLRLDSENGPPRTDGARSKCGRIEGCYLHGLFAADGYRHAFLNRIRKGRVSGFNYENRIETILDRFADHVASALDLKRLMEIARAQ